ncbi:sugar porter family MFS transporter [Mycobacterium botniense]|uniref:sugar porter family MFS transporter n=1 Tax=Mycobacterium botniense TaxID=84962 RepID=UPI00353122FC
MRLGRPCQQPSSHYGLLVALVAVSIGLVSGYDVSSIGGVLLFITDEFSLSARHQEVVTTALAVGDIAGAIGAGALANVIGRRKSLIVVVASYAGFALFGALSVSLPALVTARLLAGLAIGVSYVVVPVFVAESAPARIRGSLLVTYQAANVAGIALGYLSAYLLGTQQSWRWVLGLAAVPALLVLALLRRVDDTARWYMIKGRVADARRALQRGQPTADVEAELVEISTALDEEQAGVRALAEMIRGPYLRATIFVVVLGFLVQITGINAIISYGPLLFQSMGLRGNFALLVLPALIQVFALVAVFVSLVFVDRLGRRPVLLTGIAIMVSADLVLMGAFAFGGNSGGMPTVFGVVGVLLFTLGFNAGFGPLACVYAGESLPARLRSLGSAVMHTANLVANAIVVAVFVTLLTSLGGTAVFAILGALALISFVFVYRCAPETTNRQLEDIRHVWTKTSEKVARQDRPIRVRHRRCVVETVA